MKRQLMKDTFVWGILLWLIGYLLGILFFPFIPTSQIGFFIMPIGILITIWVLFKKIKSKSIRYYIKLAIIWTLIAIVFDYLFLVKLFNPEDGYYKFDVYVYYLLTLILPILSWWYKSVKK